MKVRKTIKRTGRSKRLISLLMAIALAAGLLPAPAAMAENTDRPGSEPDAEAELMDAWYQPYVDKLAGWGVMKGDGSGNMRPEDSITRAEYVAMVNRAFGYNAVAQTNFTDVHADDWFYDDIGIAYGAGYFNGKSETEAAPNDTLTREQAAVIMARNMRLQPLTGESTSFTDGRDLSSWSKGLVEAIAREGIISGYEDGSFRPGSSMTRAEMATMVARAVSTLIQTSGDQNLGSIYGNLTIPLSGVTLRDTVIAGDLYLTGGVGLGAVTLENVTVLGKIVVSGAGESNRGDSSVILRNTSAKELVLDSIANNFVTVRTEGVGTIDRTVVRTKAFLDDVCPSDRGMKAIEIRGNEGLEVQLAGNIKEVTDFTPYSKLILTQGRAETVTVDEEATGATMEIALGATVNTLNLDTGATVNGKGDINRLNVNAAGCIVEMLPDYITIRPGITAIIAGETMDTTTAMESSAQPRILAGFPAVKDVAPTSATAVFQTNKKGTVYWALTAIADGSVTEEDLINPPVYGGTIIKSGHMEMPSSNTDQTIPLTELLQDGSYYVSAVLVDNRDQSSPVKVAAFTTPDDSTPEFATEPAMIGVTHENAFVTVMPTKSCQLYYAVLPKGAVAPTIPEFKAGAITGNLGYGSMAVTKNTTSTFQVNSTTLDELTDYVLYLLLMDADGSKNSGIKAIDFSTPDGTPPIFVTDPYTTDIQKDSLTLTATVNEDATIYWVVVPVGEQYPVPQPGQSSSDLSSEYAKIQVENGMGSGKIVTSGNVKATGNKQTEIKISGLQEATSYDIYYIAKDAAGNYSAEVGMKNENTLDTTPPTVTQEFTKTSDTAGTIPSADTDIRLVFSENVMFKADDVSVSMVQMYNDGLTNKDTWNKLMQLLEENIVLMDDNSTRGTRVPLKDESNKDGNSWIDYQKVEIKIEETKTVIRFPYNGGNGAHKLASGGSYHFELDNICDVSSNRNSMDPPHPWPMPVFTVASARVILEGGAAGSPLVNKTELDVMDFTLTPVATDTVEDSVFYDIYLWSDMTIAFDLYVRVLDDKKEAIGTGEGSMNSGMSMFFDKDSNRDESGEWIKLGEASLRQSQFGRKGVSVNRIIRGDRATVYPRLRELNSQYTYEFGIKLKQVGQSTNEDEWSQNVTIGVTAVSGSRSAVSGLSGRVGLDDGWKQWETDIESKAVSCISYDIRGNQEFSISKQFRDTKVPAFDGGYPTFDAGDQSVKLNLMLDRTGTVYYIIAPVDKDAVSGNLTRFTYGTEFNDKTGGKYTYGDVPENGEKTKADGAEMSNLDLSKAVTSIPMNSKVYADAMEKILSGEDQTKSRLKYGNVQVGTALTESIVRNLEPEKEYMVYMVVKGASDELSPTHCFRFKTTKVTTPYIRLQSNGDEVILSTSTSSDGYWILFPSDYQQNGLVEFNKPFWSFIDSTAATGTKRGNLAQYQDKYKDKIDGGDERWKTITILEALLTNIGENTLGWNENYSIFDVFANTTLREDLLSLVTRQWNWEVNNSGKIPQGPNDPPLEPIPNTINVDCSANLSSTVPQYYFIAAMKNSMGEDYSFKAVGDIHQTDKIPPRITSVTTVIERVYSRDETGLNQVYDWQVSGDLKKLYSYLYYGKVTIRFTEDIYILNGGEPDTTGANRVKVDSDLFGQYSDSSGMTISNATVSGTTLTFNFRVAQPGSHYLFPTNGYISDEFSNSLGEDAILEMDFAVSLNENEMTYARFNWKYVDQNQDNTTSKED